MEFDRERLTVSPLGNMNHQAKRRPFAADSNARPLTASHSRPICKTPEARTILAFAITAHARTLRAASPVHSDKLPRSPHSSHTPNPTGEAIVSQTNGPGFNRPIDSVRNGSSHSMWRHRQAVGDRQWTFATPPLALKQALDPTRRHAPEGTQRRNRDDCRGRRPTPKQAPSTTFESHSPD